MAYELDIELAMACLNMAEAEARIERQRLLALERLYAGTDRSRAEALPAAADHSLDEAAYRLRDLLMKQRLALERRFASLGTKMAEPRTDTLERR